MKPNRCAIKTSEIQGRIRHFYSRITWSVKYHGLPLTLLWGVVRGLSLLGLGDNVTRWYKEEASLRFDKRFGVNTAGRVNPEQLDITEQQRDLAVQYQPTASVTFGLVLSELNINYENYIFIDYGSGKGRALILAAFFPFRRIIGVEVSHELHRAAMENLGKLRARTTKCHNIESVCEDAITFTLPLESLVLYLYHPFSEYVLDEVLKNVFRSLSKAYRHIIVIYQHPIGQGSAPKAHRELKATFDRAEFLRTADIGINRPGWDVYETITSEEFAAL